jgi:ubiquinone/menaquinone biosynthesis C-methylase UbiE
VKNEQGVSHANAERFDSIAATFDDNSTRIALARAVASAIIEEIPLDGGERAMELGCGTGLVTALLASNLAHVLAVDGSAGMLDVLRRKLHDLGIQNVESLEADLANQMPKGPFDLIFSSMTLHHIEDVERLFVRIYDQLAPGGRVAFADLALEDGTFHAEDVPGVMHHGFEAAELLHWLEAAKFVDLQVRTAHVIEKTRADGSMREYPVLLVTGQRLEDSLTHQT